VPIGIAMELRERMTAQDAWTAFWQDPAAGMQCVRGAPEITEALRAHWSAFAASLAPDARVLDLGCGAGAAAGALLLARPDLQITGVDYASVPATADGRIRLISNTAMESLPFAAASFDAVISQYGYEYSRTHKTANQLARVLAPAGRFSFAVHHAGSSVIAANRARLNAILAVQAPDMRADFVAGNAFAVEARMSSLRRAYPGDALVAKLAQLLPQRARAGGQESAWRALEGALAMERTILEAMDSSCVAPEELDGWLGPLRQFCVVTAIAILRKQDGTPIAWQIDGTHRPATGVQ
jgi:SAM-dependent methyltransferase